MNNNIKFIYIDNKLNLNPFFIENYKFYINKKIQNSYVTFNVEIMNFCVIHRICIHLQFFFLNKMLHKSYKFYDFKLNLINYYINIHKDAQNL